MFYWTVKDHISTWRLSMMSSCISCLGSGSVCHLIFTVTKAKNEVTLSQGLYGHFTKITAEKRALVSQMIDEKVRL